jgi:hypothetical protein
MDDGIIQSDHEEDKEASFYPLRAADKSECSTRDHTGHGLDNCRNVFSFRSEHF